MLSLTHEMITNFVINESLNLLHLRNKRTEKEDGSYVTEADLALDDLIKLYLDNLYANKIHYLSEEKEDNSWKNVPFGEYLAIIDPIDGTENFTSGLKEWGVSISIYKMVDDESVRQPTNVLKHEQSFLIMPELGTYISTIGTEVKKSKRKFTSRIKGLSSSLRKEDLLNLEEGFEYRIIGCSVYNLYNVIMGSYDSYENVRGVNTWDLMAGINIARNRGLKVTINDKPYNGEFLPPTQKYKVKITG